MNRFLPLVGALLICAAPAFAQDAPLTGSTKMVAQASERRGPQFPITDDQRQKMGALRDQYELSTAQTKAQLHVSQRQLHQLIAAATVDKSAALSLQSKINGLRATLSDARLNLMLASSEILTADQKAEMKKFRGHGRPGMRGGKRGHGGCGGPGGPGGPGGHRGFGPGGPGGPGGPAGRAEADTPQAEELAFAPGTVPDFDFEVEPDGPSFEEGPSGPAPDDN